MKPFAWRDALLALAAFAFTVVLAVLENWQAADLVWGMWITSLVTGYWLSLLAVFASFSEGRGFLHRWAGHARGAPAPELLGSAVLFLLFFSSHFLLLHLGQEMIVQRFFPLPGSGGERLPFLTVTWQALAAYWPVVLVTLLLRRRDFHQLVHAVPAAVLEDPYRAVMRNQLVLFMVGGFSAWGAGTWLLYALLVFCFFPLGVLLGTETADGPAR